MAVKDKKFMERQVKDIDDAMRDLGIVLEEKKVKVKDPADQFDFNPQALREDSDDE
ncbi:hypothetical protein NHG28_07210 [Aerococcaceae bacterium NML201209]|nr:hypothetical protein [Aerococcaceae bacterium NML201209]MCW6662416.1 hypothetical protein [Aerococcaceae bacterium NML190073]MCW6664405.1 hypothetical protein [Aerococcaceae bacterium NML191219]MCW6676014.1 hypothetical protein [Aerococcaceae bacterium NML180378]